MNEDRKVAVRWLAGLSLAIGAWLLVAPAVLGLSSGVAVWNTMISGGLIALFGVWQMIEPDRSWPGWLSFLAALWLIIFPYILNPIEVAAYNNAVWSGVALAVLALIDGVTAASISDAESLRHRPM